MPAKKKIDYDEFRRLNDDGWTIAELAEHYQVNRRTVSRVRSQLGIAHEYLGRPMTDERKAVIQQMIDDCWSHEEIHRTEGADVSTLRKYWPGTAWTDQQRAQHASTLRTIGHFNRRPKQYDQRKYQAA